MLECSTTGMLSCWGTGMLGYLGSSTTGMLGRSSAGLLPTLPGRVLFRATRSPGAARRFGRSSAPGAVRVPLAPPRTARRAAAPLLNPYPPSRPIKPNQTTTTKSTNPKTGEKKKNQTVSKIRHNPTRDDPSSNPPLRRAPGFHTSTHFVRDAEDENRMPTTLWDVWAVPPAHPWMPETPPAVSEAVLSVRLKAQCWVSAA